MTALLAWSVTLVRPWMLLVLLLAPVFFVLTWRATRGRPRAADWSALVFRALLLATIALALSVPRMEFEADTRSVAYLLDVSDSVPTAARRRMQDYIATSAPLRGDDDDAAFLVFADGAAIESPFSRISESERVDTVPLDPTHITSVVPAGESDIQGALRLARASFPPGGARRIVLFTDGNETRGDALPLIEALVADGVDVQIVPVRYSRDREVWVRKLVVPSTAARGQNVPVRAVVMSTHDGVPVRVHFLVNDEEVAAQDETLSSGSNVFELGMRFAEDRNHKVEVRVDPVSGSDGDPENNRGLARTTVRGDPRVLVVSNEDGSPLAEALSSSLEAEITRVGAAGMPQDPSDFDLYDAVVLENVPAWALSEAQMRFLSFAVSELGLGLVCVGGTQAYGPGGYAGTEIESLLPVSSEVKQKRVLPSGALVVILHTCEFPGGNEMGRQVTKLALRALSERDEFGVVDFEWGDAWIVPFQRVGDKNRIYTMIDGANPGDMPSFAPSMEMAEAKLGESNAASKHMIIISDGDASPPSAKLIQKLVDQKLTISTVEIDSHGGVGILQQLAKDTGGRFYKLSSQQKSNLPEIFIKEAVTVRRSAWKEEPFAVAISGVHDMIRGFSDGDFPALRGYTITTAKPETEVVLSGPEADPILASWHHGLGEVVAWTSDASKRWSQDWIVWGGYGRFWGQVVRTTQRAVQRPGLKVETDVENGTAHVQLDALKSDGSFLNGLSVRGRSVAPDGRDLDFDVVQTGPGRYEGKFPASKVGTYLSTLSYQEPDRDGPPAVLTASASVAYSAEHLAQASDERFFARAEASGATLLDLDELERVHADDPKTIDPALLPWSGEAKSSSEPLDLWPFIAALAAFLLVTDVAVRRVRVKLSWPAFLRRRTEPKAKKPLGPAATGVARAPSGRYRPEDAAAAVPEEKQDEKKPPAPGPEAGPAGGPGGLLGAKRRAKRRQDWEEN